jgi:thiamine-phosphate pyrophosphorylase
MKRFAITQGTLRSGGDDSDLERMAERCAALGQDGVEFILIREKQLSERELYLATRRILKAVQDSRTLIFVAGHPQVALAANADGVHVGSNYAMVREAKRVVLESWVSVSCHSLSDVEAARAAGADVCLFGPVFGKTVEGVVVVPGVGLEALRTACAVAGKDLPVFALGGVTEGNAAACLAAGASGVAGIRLFFSGKRSISGQPWS